MKKPNLKTMIMAVSMGVLLFILGTGAPTYAQQKQHEQGAKPPKQEQQAKPEKQKQRAEPARQEQEQRAKGQQEQRQQQTKPEQQQQVKPEKQQQANRPSPQVQRVQQSEQRGVWQQHRAHSWQAEHRTWQQRGGYNGYWIPEDHFRGQFGRNHRFRIHSLSLEIFGGYPRFQYGGFWFSVVDPWPEYWSDGWYENDDVYIDYFGDGYYLYNRRHPRDRIAITVYLN
jgi:hypothetical protein